MLEFDSTHGRFPIKIYEDGKYLFLGNKKVKYSNFNNLEEAITFHDNIDIILECSGKFKNVSSLSNFFEKKIRKIIFSYPIKNEYVKNIVMGVNHLEYKKNPSFRYRCQLYNKLFSANSKSYERIIIL